MRKFLALFVLLVFPVMGGLAQGNSPTVEVFGGYSYMRAEGAGFSSGWSAHGWAASLSASLPERLDFIPGKIGFGVTVETAGQYGNRTIAVPVYCIILAIFPCPAFLTTETDSRSAQFLVGPRLSLRGERLTAFGHALFGAGQTRTGGFTLDVTDFPAVTQTDFAVAYGGGLDWNVNDRWAVRVAQVDYLPVRTGGTGWKQNARLQAGVVVKF